MNKAIEPSKLTVTKRKTSRIQLTLEICVQIKIMIKTKRTYPLPPSTPVTVFLIAEKLLSLCL